MVNCHCMKVVCPHCRVLNKVSPEKSQTSQAKCGKCKENIEPEAPGYPVEANQVSLRDHLQQKKVPVFLDIWGSGCPPCQQLAPVLKTLAKDLAGKVKVVKLNAEQNPMAAQAFKVRGVPTLVLFQDGKEVARTMGFQPLEKLKSFIDSSLK